MDDWVDYPQWDEGRESDDEQDAGAAVDDAASLLMAFVGSVGLILCLIAAGFAAYYLG
jgi:hypothetical protein